MLRSTRWRDHRAARGGGFLVSGAVGLVLNQALLWAALTVGLNYVVGVLVASQLATVFTFTANEVVVFRRQDPGRRGVLRRFWTFDALNLASLTLRVPLLVVLTSGLHVYVLVGNILSIGVLTGIRFLIADRWIWKPPLAPDSGPARVPSL